MTRTPISLATTLTLGLGLVTLAQAQTPAKAPAATTPAAKAPATPATPAAKTPATPATPAAKPAAAPAAAQTADAIMQRVEDKKFGEDLWAVQSLEIIPKSGQKRLRRYSILRKDYGSVSKLVTYLEAPTDVRGAAFMVWDEKKSDDQRWLYLPAIGQVRQLVAGDDNRQGFFGSDFVLEDFTNRDPVQDTHKLVGSQKVDNWDCWVIDSTPKNTKGLDFASMRTWVTKNADAASDMVVRQELKDAQGKVWHTLQVKEIKVIDGIATFTQLLAKNIKTGSESRIVQTDTKYNQGVPDERFNQSQLQRGAPKADELTQKKK